MPWQYVHIIMDSTAFFLDGCICCIIKRSKSDSLKLCAFSQWREKGYKASLFVYHINNGMRELTGSPLYHTVTIINSNIHSGGVSLQQTKKERYVMFYATFFLKMRNIP